MSAAQIRRLEIEAEAAFLRVSISTMNHTRAA